MTEENKEKLRGRKRTEETRQKLRTTYIIGDVVVTNLQEYCKTYGHSHTTIIRCIQLGKLYKGMQVAREEKVLDNQ